MYYICTIYLYAIIYLITKIQGDLYVQYIQLMI